MCVLGVVIEEIKLLSELSANCYAITLVEDSMELISYVLVVVRVSIEELASILNIYITSF